MRPQIISPGETIPWHVHRRGYAALVLDGSYVEAGDAGRLTVQPGYIVIHPPFSAHVDHVGGRRVELFNLPLPIETALTLSSGTVGDPEELLRAFGEDPAAAVAMIAEQIRPVEGEADGVDLLARALREDGTLSIGEWADRHGISERTVTRHFSAAFSITPAQYRLRVRTLNAWRAIVGQDMSLAEIAADQGFADQAHMTRAVRSLTGLPPGHWRRSSAQLVGLVQDRGSAFLP